MNGHFGKFIMVPLTFDSGKYDKTFVVPNNVAGYVPKNNKLFTYPYFYLRYYSTQGDNHVFRFELEIERKVCISDTI